MGSCQLTLCVDPMQGSLGCSFGEEISAEIILQDERLGGDVCLLLRKHLHTDTQTGLLNFLTNIIFPLYSRHILQYILDERHHDCS